MTLKEFKEFEQKIINDVQESHQKLLDGCNNQESRLIYDKYRFLFQSRDAILDFEGVEFQNLQIRIAEFSHKVHDHLNKFMFKISEHTSISCDDDMPFVHEYGFIAEWCEVKNIISPKDIEAEVMRQTARVLNPNTKGNFTRAIDCKVFSLFKEDKISFNTMQLLTYGTCEI